MNTESVRKLLPILMIWAALLSLSSAWGQTGGGVETGAPREDPFTRMYDPGTVETLTGRVNKVERLPSARGGQTGIHIQIDTGEERVPVYLGPVAFLQSQQMRINPGDEVTVTGSRVQRGEEEAIIAATVQAGDQVLSLRDPKGTPAWAGTRFGRGRDPAPGGRDAMTGPRRPGTMRGDRMESRDRMERRDQMRSRQERMMGTGSMRETRLQRQMRRMDEARTRAEKMEAMENVLRELVRQRRDMAEARQQWARDVQSGGRGSAGSERGSRDGSYGGRNPWEGAGNRVAMEIPAAMEREHEDLHARMEEAVAVGGRTGAAAREVEERLAAHFQEENEIAMPLLGLLPALSTGGVTEEMRPAIELAEELEVRLADFLEEHERIYVALDRLEEAAKAEGNAEQVEFARRLRLHAQNEEQVLYPAGILIGKYIEDQLER